MGLLDRIKLQASELADRAQDLGKQGQDRIEQVQTKGRANSLLRDLGAATYAERTGKASAATSAQLARAMGELRSLEASGVEIPGVAPSAPASPADLTTAATTTPAATTAGSAPAAGAADVVGTSPGPPLSDRDVTIDEIS